MNTLFLKINILLEPASQRYFLAFLDASVHSVYEQCKPPPHREIFVDGIAITRKDGRDGVTHAAEDGVDPMQVHFCCQFPSYDHVEYFVNEGLIHIPMAQWASQWGILVSHHEMGIR